MLRVVHYLASLEKMPLPAGKIVSSSAGLLDVMATNYVAEIALAQPPQSGPDKVPDTSVPMRVGGLNPRWSAGLFQIKGYNGGNYYSNGSNRYRPLGMDEKGRVYAPPLHSESVPNPCAGRPSGGCGSAWQGSLHPSHGHDRSEAMCGAGLACIGQQSHRCPGPDRAHEHDEFPGHEIHPAGGCFTAGRIQGVGAWRFILKTAQTTETQF